MTKILLFLATLCCLTCFSSLGNGNRKFIFDADSFKETKNGINVRLTHLPKKFNISKIEKITVYQISSNTLNFCASKYHVDPSEPDNAILITFKLANRTSDNDDYEFKLVVNYDGKRYTSLRKDVSITFQEKENKEANTVAKKSQIEKNNQNITSDTRGTPQHAADSPVNRNFEKIYADTVHDGECLFLKAVFLANEIHALTKKDVEIKQGGNTLTNFSITVESIHYNKANNSFICIFKPIDKFELLFTITILTNKKKYFTDASNFRNIKFDNPTCRKAAEIPAAVDIPTTTSSNIYQYIFYTCLLIGILVIARIAYVYFNKKKSITTSNPDHNQNFNNGVADENIPADAQITFLDDFALLQVDKKQTASNLSPVLLDGHKELINLDQYFTNTSVAIVYISEEAARDVFLLLFDSVKTRPAPEVGGFLMGRIQTNVSDAKKLDVIIDKFIKDGTPNYQDNFTITFSAQISVDELDYLNNTPGSLKVGWLHTHPGHGIFLSEPDLKTHLQAFPFPYQIAIVIESYDEFKTGVFSYKLTEKEINNSKDKNETNFKSWTNLIYVK